MKPDAEKMRQDFALKSVTFSRYLMIRYFTAAYFFTNLFWLIFSFYYRSWAGVICPLILLILLTVASIEQIGKWHTESTKLNKTKLYYQVQGISNVLFIGLLWTPICINLFPFVTTTDIKYFILSILLLGLVGILTLLKRINNIENGHDRYLKVISKYKEYKKE